MKQLDLVRVREVCKNDYRGVLPVDENFVFMGDIRQMPGHGVFITVRTNKVYVGYHTSSFEVVPRNEV